MLVSKSWCEEIAKDILWEFENLLCDNDIKFENEESYINKKDYDKLKEKIIEQLMVW